VSEHWVPLSIRGTDREQAWREVLFEGVPAHMAPSLYAVVLARLTSQRTLGDVVQRRLRLDLAGEDDGHPIQKLLNRAKADPVVMLDVVDCLLDEAWKEYKASETQAPGRSQQDIGRSITDFMGSLMRVLIEANSMYEVELDDDRPWLLRRRVDRTMMAAAHDAFERGTTAGGLLAQAWTATFRRTPDFDAAFRDVMLAVESVGAVLIPDDERPSIGKATDHLGRTLARWTVADLDDKDQKSAATLHAMLQTLRQNHQRHVRRGGSAPEPVDQAEAEAVLFLGITLVQWFERGHVRRVGAS
jgi:hypothetical protein